MGISEDASPVFVFFFMYALFPHTVIILKE